MTLGNERGFQAALEQSPCSRCAPAPAVLLCRPRGAAGLARSARLSATAAAFTVHSPRIMLALRRALQALPCAAALPAAGLATYAAPQAAEAGASAGSKMELFDG